MAIQKSITLDSGVVADYVKVMAISYRWGRTEGENRMDIGYAVYLNSEARLAGKDPVITANLNSVDLSGVVAADINFADPAAMGYAILKKQEGWTDGVDC